VTASANKNAKKTRGCPFEHGNKASSGRPKGRLNDSTLFFNSAVAGEIDGLVRTVLDKAKSGNLAAVKLVFDRAIPVPKGRPVALTLPAVQRAEDIPAAIAAVVAAMAEGVISPEEANSMSGVIEQQRRALELVQLEARVSALEQKAGSP
jgi:hypothetical protein